MKIFSRYVLKEMIGPTLLGFIFYTSIILMRQLFDLAGLIIKRSLSGAVIGKLLLFILPSITALTLPMSLLFGILIAVGRLSSDSEIVAMRALGISTRTIYRPVFFFSFVMAALNFYLINSVLPESNREFGALQAELTTSAAENVIKARIFHTGYANLMIYVDDIDPGTGQWKGVFVADSRSDASPDPVTPSHMAQDAQAPQDRDDLGALSQSGVGQRIIVANSGNLALVQPSKDIWMNLRGAETHVWNPTKPDRYDLTRNETQRVRLPSTGAGATFDPHRLQRSMREMNLSQLIEARRRFDRGDDGDRLGRRIARIEIHKKLAIPFACIAFGMLGLPLGITNRRGGKSSGFTLSIAIIVVYYVLFNHGDQLATDGKISAALGIWGPNLLLLGAGMILLSRANKDFTTKTDAGIVGRLRGIIGRLRVRRSAPAVIEDEPSALNRLDITFPNILDRYILREFLKILGIVVLSVLALSIIIDFTDKARDARANGIAASTLLTYYRVYSFTMLNWTVPISVLVATLVTFALLSKNSEITAMKSSGVSLYRLALPILAIAALLGVVTYLNLDFVLPYSTRRLEEIKRVIDGKPPIAIGQQKLWYRGKGRHLINFLAYDRDAKRLTQVQVYELHPTEFRMTRRVYADRATWNGKGWVFENGWVRSFPDNAPSTYTLIKEPLEIFYPETPEDFALDVRLPDQMTFAELSRYLETLKASGYTADALAVKLYEKTSWPALSLVMALIALPFAFRMGKRGALYGIAIALVLGIVYWIVFALFMKFGEVGNLPPLLAAWAANVLFGLVAAYMFLQVET